MSKSQLLRDVYSYGQIKGMREESFGSIDEVFVFIDGRMSQISEMLEAKECERALPLLLDTYTILTERSDYPSADEEYDEDELWIRLAWICLRISYCYCEQEDYVRAYYYIEMVRCIDTDCFMEWINVLVSSGRADALYMIEIYIKDPTMVSDIFFNKDDQKKIRDFLMRRQAYLYIEKGDYATARIQLTELLSNPDSCVFAREELEYLNELEKKE